MSCKAVILEAAVSLVPERVKNRLPRGRIIQPDDGLVYPKKREVDSTGKLRLTGEVDALTAAALNSAIVDFQHDLRSYEALVHPVYHTPYPWDVQDATDLVRRSGSRIDRLASRGRLSKSVLS